MFPLDPLTRGNIPGPENRLPTSEILEEWPSCPQESGPEQAMKRQVFRAEVALGPHGGIFWLVDYS